VQSLKKKMEESAVVFCAKDGISIVLKVLKGPQMMPAFNVVGVDPLMTKKIDSKLTVDNLRKCGVEKLGESSLFVVFAAKDERKFVTNLIKKTASFNHSMPLKQLCEYIANHLKEMSLHGSETRAQVLFTCWNYVQGPELYAINSDKSSYKYFRYAIGGEQDFLNSHLSCIQSQNLTTVECFVEGMKILMQNAEEEFEYKLIRIGVDTQGKCEQCSDGLCNEVLLKALQK
jgi:hypothetical protein